MRELAVPNWDTVTGFLIEVSFTQLRLKDALFYGELRERKLTRPVSKSRLTGPPPESELDGGDRVHCEFKFQSADCST